MTRLLFDCTTVYSNPSVNTGIQRVVRNIIANLPRKMDGCECIPVAMLEGKLYRVKRLIPDNSQGGWFGKIYSKLVCASSIIWLYCQNLKGAVGVMLRGACRLGGLPFAVLLRLLYKASFGPLSKRILPIAARPSDNLILLDSTWQEHYFKQIEDLKSQGLKITAVIYDVIPLTHPEYFESCLHDTYTSWFDWVARKADGFAGISRTVRDEVQEVVEKLDGPRVTLSRAYSYFHLGSELDLKEADRTADERLPAVFSTEHPVFLAVGTIEPRKNHGYLLDVFDLLWKEGSKARLCLVGRVGWKCDAFMGRATKHSELGQKLFMFNALDDSGLEYAYANASALIFPSFAEGFGLPLVESMQRGLPAIASDIPVFREVGGDYLAYCDPRDPETCAAIIREFERTGRLPGAKPLDDWKWITWRESAEQLIEAVTRQ